jgi:hypothetical protein
LERRKADSACRKKAVCLNLPFLKKKKKPTFFHKAFFKVFALEHSFLLTGAYLSK